MKHSGAWSLEFHRLDLITRDMSTINPIDFTDIPALAGLEQDIEQRFIGLRRLMEITDRINPEILLDETFRLINEICRKIIPYDRIDFALFDDRGENLTRRWLHPTSDDQERPAQSEAIHSSPLRSILESGEPLALNDLGKSLPDYSDSPHIAGIAAAGMHTCLVCPLAALGKSVGFLFLSCKNNSAFQAEHAAVMRRIAGTLSSVIAKGELYELVIRTQLGSERLLRNVLPESIVKRLQAGERVIADGIPETTVVFVDIVNFVNMSAHMSPAAVVVVLNRVFSAFDALCEQYGVEKIKTIGDAYMLATGVPNPIKNHVMVAAKIALEMQELGTHLHIREQKELQFRIGIHTGPVVAGVIGTRKFSYDLWGTTVNIASRMEVNAIPGRIHVTRPVYDALKDTFELEPRGIINLKGIGDVEAFFLNAPKPGTVFPKAVHALFSPGTSDAEIESEAERHRRTEDTSKK